MVTDVVLLLSAQYLPCFRTPSLMPTLQGSMPSHRLPTPCLDGVARASSLPLQVALSLVGGSNNAELSDPVLLAETRGACIQHWVHVLAGPAGEARSWRPSSDAGADEDVGCAVWIGALRRWLTFRPVEWPPASQQPERYAGPRFCCPWHASATQLLRLTVRIEHRPAASRSAEALTPSQMDMLARLDDVRAVASAHVRKVRICLYSALLE